MQRASSLTITITKTNHSSQINQPTMTIKIEQTALTRIVDTARSPHPRHHHHLIHHPLKPLSTGALRRRDLAPPTPHPHDVAGQYCSTETDDDVCPYLLSLDSDEDCKSLSSDGSSSSCSESSIERRVSFAATLVTEVNTRPYTEDSEKGLLFYTQSETDR